jgi:raffinose/stachyose/melibiose transport system substrate-binding protein
MRKLIAGLLAGTICIAALGGCSGKNAAASGSGASGGSGEVKINFPTSWVGVSTSAPWFKDRQEAFNKQYAGKYKLEVEEIPGDQNYIDKMKVLFASNSLPDVIATGGYNLIDMMQSKFVDLAPYLEKDSAWKAHISKEGLQVNSRGDKVYGIPIDKQVMGYFYNKDLFQRAGITKTADTWDEFFQQADKLKAAGITPFSMDTADSGWVTSLMLGAMIGQNDAGEKFMNQNQPNNYNTPEFISAATNIQKLFKDYTTSDATGGKYENAASNFYAEKTAIIANGPWMISSFYDTTMAPEGFGDKVGIAAYPGNVMYNSGKIGFNVAAKTPETIEASLAFVKFMTSDESQKLALEMNGSIPDSETVTSDKVKPLVQETIQLGKGASRRINDFQSLWYANVVDAVSVQYPLLAKGSITPDKFATELTNAAAKNK